MFIRDVLPFIRESAGGAVILSRTLHTFGLGESAVAEKLGDLMRRDRNPSVGTTVSAGVVSLRINARFPSREIADRELEQTSAACEAALGDLIYGRDEDSLPLAVARLLAQHPIARKWAPAVCTAESCTGGLLAKMLTDIPGSSAYFRQGWVTYQNEAKMNLLAVAQETLEKHGAVSEQTVREMATGAANQSGAPFAMAISGIAGPGGGTPDKPVGTVWIALATDTRLTARHFLFPGDREMIRDRSAKMALAMLRFHLLGKPMPF
jgi:PncC family amidohydrolase